MHHKENGFSLVELSIAIVIIGLLVGGIVVGQTMIRNSQMRGATEELQYYTQAFANFRDKYGELPGDFSTATTIWGTAVSAIPPANIWETAIAAASDLSVWGEAYAAGVPPPPPACHTFTSDHNMTCDGDGNGYITTQGSSDTYYEQFRGWQHLILAGMIEGDVTGTTTAGANQVKSVGSNIPRSKLDGAGWGMVAWPISQALSDASLVTYYTNDFPLSHIFILGGNSYSGVDKPHQQPVFTSEEAKALDAKIDNGYPGTGKVVAQINPAGTACITSATEYNISASDRICALVFKTGF